MAITDWSLRAALFLVPVFFAWFQENYNVFDLNKSVLLRALIGLALAAWLVRFCIERRTSWAGGRRVALFGFVALILFCISALAALHPLMSLLGSYERQQGLLNIAHYFGLFFLIAATASDRRRIKALLIALLAGSGLVAAYGVVQALGVDFFRWGESSDQRIFSTFGQPNFLGHYLATLLPLSLYAFVHIARRFWQHLVFGILAAAQVFCLICTYSRGAWIAVFLTALAFILWELWRRQRRVWFFSLVAAGLALSALLSFGSLRHMVIDSFVRNGSGISLRVASILDPLSGSGKSRMLYWQAAWTAMREAPLQHQLFGFGPDGQADAFVSYYRPEWAFYEQINSYPDRAHNFIFDLLLQFGWLGALGFVAFVSLIAIRLTRYARRQSGEDYWLSVTLLAALSIYTLNNLLSFSLTGMNVVLYGLLGIAAVVAGDFRTREKNWNFFQPLSLCLMSGALIILGLIMFYGYSIRPYVADYYYFEAKKAEARQNCRALVDTMETVLEWYPSSHYYQQMYLHFGTNCFSAAGSDASRRQLGDNLREEANAIPEKERQFRTRMYMAQMYSIVGYDVDHAYYADAEALYRRLIQDGPYITVNYQDYGRLLLWDGKNEEAISVFKQGIAHSPQLAEAPNSWHIQPVIEQLAYFYELVGTAYAELGQDKEAMAWLTKALNRQPSLTATYKKLADIAYKHHDLEAAIRYNKTGFTLEPSRSLWPFGLAALYKEKGDTKTALDYARQALTLDAENEQIKGLIRELSGN